MSCIAAELLERLARALTAEDVQLFYQTAITGRRDLALAPDPRSGFEMTLLRMLAFRPAGARRRAAPGARAAAVTARPPRSAGGRRRAPAAGAASGDAAPAAAAAAPAAALPRRGALVGAIVGRARARGRGAPARQPLRAHRPPGRRGAPGARSAQSAGAHRRRRRRSSRRRCRATTASRCGSSFRPWQRRRRDPGAGAAARLGAGAGASARRRVRGRPGRAGPARALRRDGAAGHGASGKMTSTSSPARSAMTGCLHARQYQQSDETGPGRCRPTCRRPRPRSPTSR